MLFVGKIVGCNIQVVYGIVMHFRNYKSLADIFRYILFR